MVGVLKVEDVPNALPPVAALYQASVVLTRDLAVNVKDPDPQRALPVATGISGWAFIVASTGVRVSEIAPVRVFLDCA